MQIFNGMAEFYRIEGRYRCWAKDTWGDVVGDHHGHPKGFTASDDVWQQYRVFGTRDIEVAEHALALFIKNYPEGDFRIVKTMVMMSNTVIGIEHISETPDKPPSTSSYPNAEHYEHVRRVMAVSERQPPDYVIEGSRQWRRAKKAISN